MSEVPASFEVLGNETRVRILRVLGDQIDTDFDTAAMQFSELRDRVGVTDSGRFNYHLRKLRDRFIERTDDGYRLTVYGVRIVGLLLGGVYDAETRSPEPYPEPCVECGADQTVTYEHGLLRVVCANGHGTQNFLPTGALVGRDLVAAADLVWRVSMTDLALAADGICPVCRSELRRWLSQSDDAETHWVFRGRCTQCVMLLAGSVGDCVLQHPAVVSFYYERGYDVREMRRNAFGFCVAGRETVEQQDPLRVSVTASVDGDSRSLTVDAEATVVAVDGQPV